MIDPKIQRLIDRQEILDCLTRYARGVDRLDRELLLSVYHPDARDDHGAFVGRREELADWVINLHGNAQRKTAHVLGNHSCEIDGDTAHAETYCTYFGYNQDETISIAGARYLDRLERRAGEWKIADRVCIVDWHGELKGGNEIDQATIDGMRAYTTNATSSRDRNDISYDRPLTVIRENHCPPPIPDSD